MEQSTCIKAHLFKDVETWKCHNYIVLNPKIDQSRVLHESPEAWTRSGTCDHCTVMRSGIMCWSPDYYVISNLVSSVLDKDGSQNCSESGVHQWVEHSVPAFQAQFLHFRRSEGGHTLLAQSQEPQSWVPFTWLGCSLRSTTKEAEEKETSAGDEFKYLAHCPCPSEN